MVPELRLVITFSWKMTRLQRGADIRFANTMCTDDVNTPMGDLNLCSCTLLTGGQPARPDHSEGRSFGVLASSAHQLSVMPRPGRGPAQKASRYLNTRGAHPVYVDLGLRSFSFRSLLKW